MPSLGELFVELGVVGNTRELEKTLQRMKEGLRVTQKEIALSKLKLKLIKDIENAQSPEEKKRLTSLYVKEFKALNQKDAIAGINAKIAGFKALGKGIAKTITGVTAFVGAIAGAAYVMNRFTNSLVESNQELLNLTRTTDISLKTFQKWGGIGKMLGVENIDQQLEGLNQRLFELMLTGEGAKGFQLGGINPVGQDAVGVLEQLRARISGMNDTTATYLLQQMGLDPRMLHLLRMSRDEFEALGQTIERYQLSSDETRQIQQMNIQLQIAGIRLRYLRDKAILALMPLWTKLVTHTTEIVLMLSKAAREIGKFIMKFKEVAIVTVAVLSRLAPVQKLFSTLSGTMSGLIIKIPIVGRLLGGLGGWLARLLWPLTAVYLLLDDLAVFFNGGESTIGLILGLIKDFSSGINEAFRGLTDGTAFQGMIKSLLSLHKIPIPPIIMSILAAATALTAVTDTMHKINKIDNTTSSEALPTNRLFISPSAERSISDNRISYTYDQRQINMTNSINTVQPANDILSQLAFAQNAMNAGLA